MIPRDSHTRRYSFPPVASYSAFSSAYMGEGEGKEEGEKMEGEERRRGNQDKEKSTCTSGSIDSRVEVLLYYPHESIRIFCLCVCRKVKLQKCPLEGKIEI